MISKNRKTADFKKITKQPKKSLFTRLIQSIHQRLSKPPILKTKFAVNSKKRSKKRQVYQEEHNIKNNKDKQRLYIYILKILSNFLLSIFSYPLSILVFIFNKVNSFISPENLVKIVFSSLFFAIIFNFAKLQIYTNSTTTQVLKNDILLSNVQTILSQRGQIYIQDLSQNQMEDKKYVAVTATQNVANLFFNPSKLKSYLMEGLSLSETVSTISGGLNLPYNEIYNLLKTETDLDKPKQYTIVKKFIDENQKSALEYLRTAPDTAKFISATGLDIDEKEIRSYPQGRLLAATIGYVPKYQIERNDKNFPASCKQMVLENERRGTVRSFVPGDYSKSEYTVGYYGLEQKFCSVLGGLNGRKVLNNEINSNKKDDTRVENGASIYTTIDRNIQLRAEQILEESVKKNTNANGGAKNGTIIAMEANTGKILAMASYPYFEPERYNEANPDAYRNAATSIDYEVGSVMKPLTIASALNEFQSGNKNSKGDPLGIPPDFQFEDYPSEGKIYQENSGKKLYIQNAQKKSYKYLGKIGINECLTYSINTCLADISDSLGTRKMQEYQSEKYLFGKPTAVNLPGDTNGNVSNLEREINCQYCYAQHAFGQGITLSPIQLLRAYTPIANKGIMVEPYMIEKIKYADTREDYGMDNESIIKRDKDRQILKESVSRQVTTAMVAAVDSGLKYVKDKVPGYTIAAKTGTAEKITDINGIRCDYSCNREKGLYEQTIVGFNANSENPILIMIKLDEPNPGESNSFAGQAVGASFGEMMKYTMEYLGIKAK